MPSQVRFPPSLGGLSVLRELLLDNNDLSGSVPPELVALTSLRALILSNNQELHGPLPDGLTALGLLETLLAGGTGLCAPMDPTVLAWLGGIRKRRITMCAEAEPAAAYLTQAVQSLEFPVPLVAGAKALLRVFPTAARTTSAGIPPVRATVLHRRPGGSRRERPRHVRADSDRGIRGQSLELGQRRGPGIGRAAGA